MDDRAYDLLKIFYLPEAIYLNEIVNYSPKQKSATGRFIISLSSTYTVMEVNYVSAEQYIRCINQLAYCLVKQLVDDHILPIEPRTLIRLAQENKLLDRQHCLRYKMTAKGSIFELWLCVNNVEVKKNIFLFCQMNVKGPAYGTVEFVIPLKNK